jgi:hypothetical protein
MFRVLLTGDPTRWPLHAWINLPFIPFSLIASRTSYLLFTSPLISLLYPWPTSTPIASQVARGSNSAVSLVHPMRQPMWPPSPALVCALFPFVRVLYDRLRARATRALVQDYVPGPQTAQQQQRQQQQQQRQEERQRQLRLARQEQLRRGRLQRQQQPQRQPQDQLELEQRFQFRVGGEFRVEFTHFINARLPRAAAGAPGPAPAAGPAENVADQQPERPAQEEEPHADPEPQQQNPLDPQEQQPEEPPQPPQQAQEQPQEVHQGGQGEGHQQEQQQGRGVQAWDDDDFAAIVARVTGAGLGRLIGGALVMPTIARIMGAMLLHLSHVFPLVRIIIAPRPRPASPTTAAAVGGLVGLWGRSAGPLFGRRGDPGVEGGWSVTGLGAKILGEFLSTSQEWAASDPVWYAVFCAFGNSLSYLTNGHVTDYRWRNALGLGIFIVVSEDLLSTPFFLLVSRTDASSVWVFLGEGWLEDSPYAACEERARRKAHQKQDIFWR